MSCTRSNLRLRRSLPTKILLSWGRAVQVLPSCFCLVTFWLASSIWVAQAAVDLNPQIWQQESTFRWRPLVARSNAVASGFQLIPLIESGVVFTNFLSESDGAANRTLYNGSGVATGDVDGDGLPDLFLASLKGENQLFKNLGHGRFTNVTVAAGLGIPVPQTRGAVLADLNGDTSLDLLLAVNGRGVLCYTNDGHGHFIDVTLAAGTASRYGATSLTLADVDGDGTVDLYVANYRNEDIRDRGRVRMSMVNGRPVLRGSETNRFVMLNGRLEETGQPDQLYLNDGHAHFTPVSWTGGTFLDAAGKPLTEPPLDWGLAAAFRDLNGDGAPDLYVCNDYWTPDRLWWNDGHGHFRAANTAQLRKTSSSSMGVAFADIDRDGKTDFFVVDMLSRDPRLRKRQRWANAPMQAGADERPQVMRNTLFLNRGAGSFSEIAPFAQVSASDWSWSPIFLDVDLDGYEDLLIGAGHFRDVQDSDAEAQVAGRQRNWDGFPNDADRQRAFTAELEDHYHLYPKLDLPVVAFRNRGDSTFEEVTTQWGLDLPAIHHGMAVTDFEGDGVRDLVVNVLNGPAKLFHGISTGLPLVVRLRGQRPNTSGIGARITLKGGVIPEQSTEMTAGGGYESGSDPEVVFAAARTGSEMTLEVVWRRGARTLISGVQGGRLYEIEEPILAAAASPWPASFPSTVESWFADLSSLLGHRSVETPFSDFDLQPLLPFRLSEAGPMVAWVDLDPTGRDDLLIGAPQGGTLTRLQNRGSEPWTRRPIPALPVAADDLLGLAIWPSSNGTTLLWGAARYENRAAGGVHGLTWTNGAPIAAVGLPVLTNGVSMIAVADLSGAGEWVLFAGGGARPGAYPRGEASELFRWDGQRWRVDARSRVSVQSEGRVGGAVWSDLNGDGRPELVVATDWGPIRVFQDRSGVLYEITTELGLGKTTGWWRGLTVGDFNGDGRMDIVAMNWGRNSVYQASAQAPLIWAYGETVQPGITDVFETEWVQGQLALRRPWASLVAAVPYLAERFSSVRAYSEATLEVALGERASLTRRIQINTLESTVFINTGNGFTIQPLPREAQLAPASAVTMADFDGDGFQDLFVAQNDFSQPAEATRIDAGAGGWLRGDGRGGFSPVSAVESGIEILGVQRGCAVADFDGDGRSDLVVTQNRGMTRLFRNQRGKAGLRVQLQGTLENPKGIGAQLRLRTATGWGPTTEIHAGSGSGSQDSLTVVLTAAAPVQGIWVRWPGGRITEAPLADGVKSVTLEMTGKTVTTK